jgi:glycosyltransferase involved in cell wall biosynthesis
MKRSISVIISTYNSEDWLEKVLWGYHFQTLNNFEIVIADDGSKNKTKELIDAIRDKVNYPITHVWQEDDGFQKSKILNKAIVACKTDYIVMSDGDCIPRKDFIKVHDSFKEEGYFLSGGYFMLPMNISKLITKNDIENGNCFDINWLKKNGLISTIKNMKLTVNNFSKKLLNFLTPTKPTWNGHNASGWKNDILSINGFNEDMQYGGQDRELGERLFNLGIKSKQIRYSAIVVHLDHKRGYKTKESITKNQNIRKNTRNNKVIKTLNGIEKV